MKHRRGIDLTATADAGYTVSDGSRRSADYDFYSTIDKLPDWYVILGWCQRCRRYGQIERRDIRRVLGAGALLADIGPRLVCTVCHQRRGNGFSIRKLPR